MSALKSLSVVAALALQAAAAPLEPRDFLSCPSANGQQYQQGGATWSIECATDRFMGDMPGENGLWAQTIYDCIGMCTVRDGCILVNYEPDAKKCWLKSSVGDKVAKDWVMGAVKATGGSVSIPQRPAQDANMPPTTSAPSYSPPTYSPPASSGGKRGLCFNDASVTNAFGSKISWSYDWAQTHGKGYNSAITYIPMLWGSDGSRAADWKASADAGIAAGANALLGYNEPDHREQANLDVGAAVAGWKASMEQYAGKGITLVSPAVTNGPAPMGLAYLSSFVSSCQGCQIDACAVHWYDSASNTQYFKNHITDAITACGGKPIWLTEFGASGSDDQIVSFLQEVLPWMDSNPDVAKYAYFMAATGGQNLLKGDGGLSTIGQAYNSI